MLSEFVAGFRAFTVSRQRTGNLEAKEARSITSVQVKIAGRIILPIAQPAGQASFRGRPSERVEFDISLATVAVLKLLR